MRRALAGNPRISNTHGAPGWGHFGRHLGYDYAVGIGTHIYAPEAMVIKALPSGGSGGRMIYADSVSGGRSHRFLHLSNNWLVRVGQRVNEGDLIGRTGNTGNVTGPHLHHDVRKVGTTWSASFSNYFDWEQLIKAPTFNLPPVGSNIQLIPTDTRTTFRAGTSTKAGAIRVTNNSFVYTVRGHDPVYKNRILINSASAGGDGVSLALYYLSGNLIPGWKRV